MTNLLILWIIALIVFVAGCINAAIPRTKQTLMKRTLRHDSIKLNAYFPKLKVNYKDLKKAA